MYKANLRAVIETLQHLYKPAALIELCAIGDNGIATGLYDDHDALAREAKNLSDSRKYNGVFVTVNPLKKTVPQEKGREKNRVYHNVADRTRDCDIERRSWFILDIDPIRKPNTSATDRQKAAASWCMSQAIGTLRREFRLPEPVTADSGNGYYALYAVDMPNDEESRALFKKLTKALSAKFSIQPEVEGEIVRVAEIDEVTFNAARLVKLFGTAARKGPNTDVTPHRVSRLLRVPNEIQVMTRTQLDDLVAKFGAKPTKPTQANGSRISAAKVEEFLKWAEIGVKGVTNEADGSTKWILSSCPFDQTHTNSPAVFLRQNGTLGYHCFHKSCENFNWNDFQAIVEKVKGKKFSLTASEDYWDSDAGIFWRTSKHGVETDKKLTNFTARIIADIREDDGVNFRHEMKIEAVVKGRTSTLTIPASEFKSMNWVLEKLGGEAVVYPGPSTADHARTAIQLLSTNIDRRVVYTHTGWRKIDGRSKYLHGRGAIGENGIETTVSVKLPPALESFQLPAPPTEGELNVAIRASLRSLDVGPHSLTVPLFAALCRGALKTCDFSLHLTGETGTFKSSLLALELQHFGKGFNSRRFPANWSDTENNIGQLQFVMKDAPIGIDDFVLKGSQNNIAQMHVKADRIFRGQGNNSGRGRMKQDGVTLRDPAPPRGVTLSTGEDIPRGESLQSRVWNLDFSPGDINFEKLKNCQKDAEAGLYAETMSAYLKWVAPQYDDVMRRLRKRVERYSAAAAADSKHARTPEIIGNLMAGFDFFLEFAKEHNVLSERQVTQIGDDAWDSLHQAAAAQIRGLAAEEPTKRFIDLIASALNRGDAHLGNADTNTAAEDAKGKLIGWFSSDKKELWLELNSAFAAAQELARQQAEPFAIRMRTLGTRLRDRELLTEYGKNRNTVQKKIGSGYRWVLCLRKQDVLPGNDEGQQSYSV